MKKIIVLVLVIFLFTGTNLLIAQDLNPYINVGDSNNNIDQTSVLVKNALQEKGFEILGEYNSQNKQNFKVIVVSRKDLQTTVLKVKDRGALAAAFKVGLKSSGDKTTISYVNPEYLLNAYLRDDYTKYESTLKKITADVTSVLSPLGNVNKGFGGALSTDKLRNYGVTHR